MPTSSHISCADVGIHSPPRAQVSARCQLALPGRTNHGSRRCHSRIIPHTGFRGRPYSSSHAGHHLGVTRHGARLEEWCAHPVAIRLGSRRVVLRLPEPGGSAPQRTPVPPPGCESGSRRRARPPATFHMNGADMQLPTGDKKPCPGSWFVAPLRCTLMLPTMLATRPVHALSAPSPRLARPTFRTAAAATSGRQADSRVVTACASRGRRGSRASAVVSPADTRAPAPASLAALPALPRKLGAGTGAFGRTPHPRAESLDTPPGPSVARRPFPAACSGAHGSHAKASDTRPPRRYTLAAGAEPLPVRSVKPTAPTRLRPPGYAAPASPAR